MASQSRKSQERDDADIRKAMANTRAGPEQAIPLSSVPPVLCYCVASVLMTLVNKYVVSGANFTMTCLLLSIQSLVSVICVLVFKRLGVISFRDFTIADTKTWFPISFLLVLVIYTGSKSLQFLNIPVYTIFKNLTIILIAYGESIWFGGRVTALTLVSFVFMVLSSVIAAWSDVSNALQAVDVSSSALGASFGNIETVSTAIRRVNVGYFWMLSNCLTSATYVLSMRKKIKQTGFSDWDTMFYNNLLSVPVLLTFSMVVEDWGSESLNRNFPSETRSFLLSAIAFSGAAAVGISYTTAWCIRATSSTTYSMVGALNKLPVAASGMLFFGDVVSAGSVSAIGVGFFAGLLYAIAKNNQKKTGLSETIIPLSNRTGKP